MKTKRDTLTWHGKAGMSLVLLALVIAVSFYGGMLYQRFADAAQDGFSVSSAAGEALLENQAVLPPAPAPTPRTGAFMTYRPAGGPYTLTVFKMLDQDVCGYIVNDRTGHALDVSTILPKDATLPCHVSGTTLSNGFQKWVSDSSFTMSVSGAIYLIDVAAKTATVQ